MTSLKWASSPALSSYFPTSKPTLPFCLQLLSCSPWEVSLPWRSLPCNQADLSALPSPLPPFPFIFQVPSLQCCLNSRPSPSLPAEPHHHGVSSAKASKFTCTGASQNVQPDTDNLFFPTLKGLVCGLTR